MDHQFDSSSDSESGSNAAGSIDMNEDLAARIASAVVDESDSSEFEDEDVPPPPPPVEDEDNTTQTEAPPPPPPPQVSAESRTEPETESKTVADITSAADFSSSGSFATSLTEHFDIVSKQVEMGMYQTKRSHAFLKKMAELEDTYAKGLFKLLDAESKKFEKMEADGMKIFNQHWKNSLGLVRTLAEIHSDNAASIVKSVVTPIENFQNDSMLERKQLQQDERTKSKAMGAVRKDVLTKRHQSFKSLQKCRQAHGLEVEEEAKTEEEQKKKKKKAGGFLSRMKQAAKQIKKAATTEKTPAEMQEKAVETSRAYALAVQTANKHQEQYLGQDLPAIFEGMQNLETSRLDRLRDRLSKFANLSLRSLEAQRVTWTDVLKEYENMDTATDIDQFIENCIFEHGPPRDMVPYVYELSCSPEDIKNGRFEGNPKSLFNTSLQRLMDFQKEEYPDLDLKVPRVLICLRDAVYQMDGLQAEGIFRLSTTVTELDTLCEQLDSGNYDDVVSLCTTPHTPAACLKKWLRFLSEPLISDSLYQSCVDLAKEKDASTQACQEIFQKLPDINQAVLQECANICKKVIEHEAVNRMSMEALAVVFAPGVLRNPSEDPLVLLQNSKFESRFTALLFDSIV